MSTTMFYTGIDPRDMKKVYIPSDPKEKAMQRALMQYFIPSNHKIVMDALKKAGREDLIGWEKNCLIPPYLREKKKVKPEQDKAKKAPAQKKTERRNEKPAKHNNRKRSVSKKETGFGKKKHGR